MKEKKKIPKWTKNQDYWEIDSSWRGKVKARVCWQEKFVIVIFTVLSYFPGLLTAILKPKTTPKRYFGGI